MEDELEQGKHRQTESVGQEKGPGPEVHYQYARFAVCAKKCLARPQSVKAREIEQTLQPEKRRREEVPMIAESMVWLVKNGRPKPGRNPIPPKLPRYRKQDRGSQHLGDQYRQIGQARKPVRSLVLVRAYGRCCPSFLRSMEYERICCHSHPQG